MCGCRGGEVFGGVFWGGLCAVSGEDEDGNSVY